MTTATLPTASSRRPHCTCVTVQNYDYDQAAEKLGCHRSFLERKISQLPHMKLGESTVFCECDLRLILQLFTVVPESVWAALTPQPDNQSIATPTLRSIKPSGAGRRTAAK